MFRFSQPFPRRAELGQCFIIDVFKVLGPSSGQPTPLGALDPWDGSWSKRSSCLDLLSRFYVFFPEKYTKSLLGNRLREDVFRYFEGCWTPRLRNHLDFSFQRVWLQTLVSVSLHLWRMVRPYQVGWSLMPNRGRSQGPRLRRWNLESLWREAVHSADLPRRGSCWKLVRVAPSLL